MMKILVIDEAEILTFEAAQSIQPSAHGSTLMSTSPSTRDGLFSCESKDA